MSSLETTFIWCFSFFSFTFFKKRELSEAECYKGGAFIYFLKCAFLFFSSSPSDLTTFGFVSVNLKVDFLHFLKVTIEEQCSTKSTHRLQQ